MIKRLILLVVVTLNVGLTEKLFAQDAEFTQFYANPLYLNPAFAGSERCPRVCFNYRNQWPALNKTYITHSVSYDQEIFRVGGIGMLIVSDKAGNGTLTTTDASLMYSYGFHPTPEFSVRFGLQGTFHQKTLDWSKLNFGDMIDPRRGFVKNSGENPKSYPSQTVQSADFSAGVIGYSKRYFFGFAAHHLSQPNEGFINYSALPMKITGHAGAMLPLGEHGRNHGAFISPNILFQSQQNFKQLNLGVYVIKGELVGGLWYRNQDAFIILFGYQTRNFKCGYSYDVTVSRLANATAGSHEISFGLQFNCKQHHKRYRPISCPTF